MLQYHLPSGTIKLSKMFELIENHQDDLQIEDYSVSQTTLDNVGFHSRGKGREIVSRCERVVKGRGVEGWGGEVKVTVRGDKE